MWVGGSIPSNFTTPKTQSRDFLPISSMILSLHVLAVIATGEQIITDRT
jgi:hypothetical protein